MDRKLKHVAWLVLLALLTFTSCGRSRKGPDISGIKLPFTIHRFDRELFTMDQDTLDNAITYFYRTYEDFFDIFSYYVINIGRPSEKNFSENLAMFINDPLNREVYRKTQEVFGDASGLEHEFADAFKRYRYYFPGDTIPEVVAFVSRFNNPCFTVTHYIGIGLDMYLGNTSDYYERLGIPQYRRMLMIPGKLPSDALYTWAKELFPFNDSVDNVLSHMIHEGQLMYFVGHLLPDEPDTLRFGFTRSQMKWCKNNEEQMWTSMVENKLVFSQDPMEIRKLTGVAPYTPLFTGESPGRAAVWTGWRIVEAWADRNPGLSLADIMKARNYQEILRLSRYDPH